MESEKVATLETLLRHTATIACAALIGCGQIAPRSIECVNIISHERLTDVDNDRPDRGGWFNGTDWQGYRRLVADEDRKWWKCRYAPDGERAKAQASPSDKEGSDIK